MSDSSFVDIGLKYTELPEIKAGVARVRSGFHKNKSKSVQFRLNQLRNLYFAVKDNQEAFAAALAQDFNRATDETRILEHYTVLKAILFAMENLHLWTQPEKVTDLPINLRTNPVYVERIPVGVVLVMGAFNYPLFVNIAPLIGVIAAGNAAVLKPSEQTPRYTQLLTEVLTKALDPDLFFVVNGAIPETTALLEEKFDKIVFTGSSTVGTVVAKAAAKHLTPTILELGGKSPAFVLSDVTEKDLKAVARRIVWGRFTNGGQTCIACDYVLVHKSKHAALVAEMKAALEEFYPNISKDTKDYTHIVANRNYDGVLDLLKTSKATVVVGGTTTADRESRFIAPTILDNVGWTDSSMTREIFGPVLPVIEFESLPDACSRVVHYHDTPLALYVFTSGGLDRAHNSQLDYIRSSVRSGGTIVNDALIHAALSNAPFGGIGSSGMGNYGGERSFKAFSHERTTIEQKLWNEFMVGIRYPPFNAKKQAALKQGLVEYGGRVWFGRTGDVPVGGPSNFFKLWAGVTGTAALVWAFTQAL
ncbi:fatty aldehyde dehydrogenase Hfd1p [Diutina catenulata]